MTSKRVPEAVWLLQFVMNGFDGSPLRLLSRKGTMVESFYARLVYLVALAALTAAMCAEKAVFQPLCSAVMSVMSAAASRGWRRRRSRSWTATPEPTRRHRDVISHLDVRASVDSAASSGERHTATRAVDRHAGALPAKSSQSGSDFRFARKFIPEHTRPTDPVQ